MSGKSGIFNIVKQFFHIPKFNDESWMRNATHVLAGPRGRKIVFLKDDFKGKLGDSIGVTNNYTGNVYISGGVRGDAKKLHETLRHELFHSVMVPRSRALSYVHAKLLRRSSLYSYLHEAGAEAYGTRNLRQGIKFPIKYGYVKPSGLAFEISMLGGVGYGTVYWATTQDATDSPPPGEAR